MTMKTQKEVADKIDYLLENLFDDFMGFQRNDLLRFIDYKHIKHLLKEEVTEQEWDKDVLPLSEEVIRKEMEKDMDFATNKALNHRGISAVRSIETMKAYVWLLEDMESYDYLCDHGNFQNYGMPMLKFIADKYKIAFPCSEAAENMAAGKPCEPDCIEGCGR